MIHASGCPALSGDDCTCGGMVEVPLAVVPDVQAHLNSAGEPCDCGQTPPQPGLVHHLPSEQLPDHETWGRVFHTQDGTQVHDGAAADCPRCSPPGAAMLIGPDDRDRLAATDQGQYYCVSAKHGTLVSREGRPVYATLAEWQSVQVGVPGSVYIPIFGDRHGPLFGSVPFLDHEQMPDIVGRVVEVLTFLEKAAEVTTQRVAMLDDVVQKIANRPTHERELLRRAAAMIDDEVQPGPTYEERLDWLAKYREVTG